MGVEIYIGRFLKQEDLYQGIASAMP